ncbi:MAG: MATE family efflux transporter [Syntrophomonas sp.]
MLVYKEPEVRKLILKTAVPAMMEMILYMFLGVVDIAVVGRLGAVPLAAVGLGTQIFLAFILILSSVGIGSSIMAAHAKGAGKMNEVSRIAGQTYLMALVFGTIAGIIGWLLADPLLSLFPVEAGVHHQALIFLHRTFPVVPIALTYYIINSIYRGLGRTDIPMIIAFVVNIVNIVGNLILVHGLGPIPALGMIGSATATSIALVIGFFIVSCLLFSKHGEMKVKFTLQPKFNLRIIRKIFRLGLPSMGEQFFITLSTMTTVFLIVFTGTHAFASNEVATSIETLSLMPGFGIAIAATALVGHSIGARDTLTAQKMARGSLELAGLLMGTVGVLFFCFPYAIASVFSHDPIIIRTTGILVRIAAFEQLPMAATMVLGAILKGAGNTRLPMLVTTLGTWAFRIPLIYVIIHILKMPIAYVWVLSACDWSLRALVFSLVYRHKGWLPQTMGGTQVHAA